MQDWARARTVADAVLYEGYLLYPYRASSGKNQSRWQFGVLGPPGAAPAGLGEDDLMSAQFLTYGVSALRLVVRFLQLQHRGTERAVAGGYEPVDELHTPSGSWLAWEEAVPIEIPCGPVDLAVEPTREWQLSTPAGTDVEIVPDGRLVRTRRLVRALLNLRVEADGDLQRIALTLRNVGAGAADCADAIARSLIGTHIIAEALTDGPAGGFISLLEPPDGMTEAAAAAADCHQHRCFPVLAGAPGHNDLLLISPIILYDHPEVAEQSPGPLYDSTEIDEILTLRVMTMTDQEKAQARATDPLAARIIDRCDGLSAQDMLDLHGVLRDPHIPQEGLIPEVPDGQNWWDPAADTAVAPEVDGVVVGGIRVARGSRVVLRPNRRADAQDMFVAGRTARVTSVHEDVDGERHIGVVLDDDPAADLHADYGRYLYFAPDEVEALPPASGESADNTERSTTWR
ncbi:MAG TPA: hypothetical protein VFW21_15765 [Mycobacterium sp.]|nr:hypothetical protein [Mycobacterium sp.]